MTPGLYGYKKTIEVSSASLGHAAVSKLKNNIEMLSVADEGSRRTVLIKSPPGVWNISDNTISFKGNGYTITTTCDIKLETNKPTYSTNMRGLTATLTRLDNKIYINWTD